MRSKSLWKLRLPGRRCLLCIVQAALLSLGSAATVQAEDYARGDWRVEFTGNGMAGNFKSSDISDVVYALQPGDSVTVSLSLENKSDRDSAWYMTNSVIRSLEDTSSKATGGAYAYRLAYVGKDNEETVFFDSATVGGEGKSTAKKGLHEAVEDMDEYFAVDTLVPGERGTVTLRVELDGETQGNDYQNTLADLRMSFAVDALNLTSDGGGDNEKNQDGQPGSGAHSYSTGGVKTGDSNELAVWSCVAFVSGAALLALALFSMRKDREEEAA